MTNDTTAQSGGLPKMWLGMPLEFWQRVILWTMWAGFGLTALGAAVAVVSSFVAYQVSDITQSDADKRIAVAGSAASQANAEAAKANEAAAKAHMRAAGLEKEAANLKAQAEADRFARIKIEERLAPRRLSENQMQSLLVALAPIATSPSGVRQSVAVFPSAISFEAAILADQLAAVLGSAGWTINRHPVTFGHALVVSGVQILTSSNRRGIEAANTLVRLLIAEGIAAGVLDFKRRGCEEMGYSEEQIDADPACSQISVMIGDQP